MPKLLNKLNLPRYSSAPASPAEADLYYNTSDDKIYYYTGSAWQEVGSGAGGNIVYYQTTAPGTANAGDIWIDSDDNLIPTIPLTDSVSSTSTTTAATPNSVKSAYDLASAAIPKSVVTTSGDIIYAAGSGSVTRLGIGTATQVLQVGTAGIPEWGQPVATIGTANSSGTYGVTTLIDSVSNTSTSAAAVPNSVKTSYDLAVTKAKVTVGTAAPVSPATGDIWVNTAGTLTAAQAVALSTYSTTGAILYASGQGTAAALAIGTANQVLSVSAGLPAWSTLSTASTSAYGVTQLTDSTSSTSTTTAATPASVKTAYDTAATAIPKNTVTAAGDILYASGSATPARLGIGTAGQVLSVAAGLPSWTTLAAAGADVQEFTTSGSWVKPAGKTAVYVFAVGAGGGGGGGGRRTDTFASPYGGVGGSGGGVSSRWITASTLAGTVTVTIGAGGAGGGGTTSSTQTLGTAGSSGGQTSFGTAVVALGGNGGQSAVASPAFAPQQVLQYGVFNDTTSSPGNTTQSRSAINLFDNATSVSFWALPGAGAYCDTSSGSASYSLDSAISPAGGGAGGGIGSNLAGRAGGGGGRGFGHQLVAASSGGTTGATGGAGGAAGTVGIGNGGGGGGCGTAGNGGAGGNGYLGGGGGGGGAVAEASNTRTTGDGGAGGGGYVLVISI